MILELITGAAGVPIIEIFTQGDLERQILNHGARIQIGRQICFAGMRWQAPRTRIPGKISHLPLLRI